jgi:integrase
VYIKQDLDINSFSVDILRQYEQYLRDEHLLYDQLQKVFEQVTDSRKPEPRGQNTINGILTKLRTFFLWAIDNEYTANNPFRKYQVEECVYGTPYYITIEERNRLYNTDLSKHPQLAIQRDIFVFQCLIGCRVSDLYALTKANIIDGAVEYIPRKTKEGRPITVRVPLSTTAKEILDRYKDCEESLFPFISQQKYNIAIKRMFVEAGITRTVTVINPTTREEEQRPICEIASSHLARRAFVGNLYKQVKDPNLVGKLSGHKEGSKAFVRYRDIDEDMRKELVALLE